MNSTPPSPSAHPSGAGSRSRRRLAALALSPVLAASLAACSSDDEPAGDDFSETLSTLGGETVEDTSIVHTPGNATVSIGGLDVDLPQADELADMGGRQTLIPLSWPTLEQIQIRHPEAAEGFPEFGIVTFAQTDLVTREESRQQLLDQAFVLGIDEGHPITHSSTIENPDTGVRCDTTIREGSIGRLFFAEAVTLISGPGIASSGIVIVENTDPTRVAGIAGDIAEAACGQRPEGL